MSNLYTCLCTSLQGDIKRHTYRMRGRWYRTVEIHISGVVLALPRAEAEITARGEDASSFMRTKHREQVTHSGRIIQRDIRLLNTVPRPDWPDARFVEQAVEPSVMPVESRGPGSRMGETSTLPPELL